MTHPLIHKVQPLQKIPFFFFFFPNDEEHIYFIKQAPSLLLIIVFTEQTNFRTHIVCGIQNLPQHSVGTKFRFDKMLDSQKSHHIMRSTPKIQKFTNSLYMQSVKAKKKNWFRKDSFSEPLRKATETKKSRTNFQNIS